MKPHLPLKLRAALLAALVAVSFTVYSPAWAAETGDPSTETKVYEHNNPYMDRITDSLTLNSYAEINISNKNASSGEGGAIWLRSGSVVSITNSGNILFESNTAKPTYGSYGGAIYNYKNGTLDFTGNESITFSGNYVNAREYSRAYYGGAIYNESTLDFTDNGNITFSGNYASYSSTSSYGGAVYNQTDGSLNFTGNGDITFSGNYASYGGAFYNKSTLAFTGNGDITFSGNSARADDDDAYDNADGGAICNLDGGTLTFSGNNRVLFEKNYEKNGDSYILRSIHSGSGSIYLAAKEGGSIEFKDSIYLSSDTVHFFNASLDENGSLSPSYGEIIFTGESTEEDLTGIMGSTPTEAQITESRTSYVGKAATLYGGTLSIREQAILQGVGLTVQTSATKGGTRVLLCNGTLSMSGRNIAFQSGTVLDAQGHSSIAGNVTMAADSTLRFTIGEADSPILTLTGTLVQEGILTISLAGNAAAGTYTLLSVSDAFDKTNWTEDLVTVMGASFDDLSWDEQGKILYYTGEGTLAPTVVWNGGNGGEWNSYENNWQAEGNDSTFADGMHVRFTDTGAGSVVIMETLTPGSIVVVNSVGKDYTFCGMGQISGNADLTKRGAGKLTINTENPNWTGDILVKGGTLIVGSGTALGTGDVTMNGGDLNMGGNALGNAVNVNADATINGGGNYHGGLTLNSGTVDGGELNLGQDATANKGTINNNLTGTGGVIKNTDGSVTLNGSNSYAGGTSVNGGTLIAGSGTALGTGDVTMNGGELNMGGWDLHNDIIVTQDSALNGAGDYRGALTLRSGTLTGSSINIAADKTFVLENGTIDNKLTGEGGVSKDTDDSVTLNGNNTFAGGTSVSAGTLTAGHASAFGTGTVTLGGGTLNLNGHAVANAVTATGGILDGAEAYTGALTVNGSVTLAGTTTAGSIAVNGGSLSGGSIEDTAISATSGTLSSAISGTSSVTIGGDVTLGGVNDYTGATTVSGGTLTVGGNDSALGGSTVALNGTLNMGGFAVGNTVNIGSGELGTIVNGTAFAGTVNLNGGTLNLTGDLGGTLALNGGLLDLTTGVSTLSMNTTLPQVQLGTVTTSSLTRINVGDLSGLGEGTHSLLSFADGSGIDTSKLDIVGLDAITGCNTALEIQDNDLVLVLSALPQITDDIVLDGGNKVLDGVVTPGAIQVSGDEDSSITGSGSIAGDGNLDKTGSGTLIIDTENPDWTGNTTISGGTVTAGSSTALGTGDVTMNGGDLNMGGWNLNNNIIVTQDAMLNGAGDYRGALTLRSGTLTGSSINIAADKTFVLENGTIDNKLTGDGGVVKNTDGSVTLNGYNSYEGGTTVENGTLTAGSNKAFGTGGVTVNGGTLDLNEKAIANAIRLNDGATLQNGSEAGTITAAVGTGIRLDNHSISRGQTMSFGGNNRVAGKVSFGGGTLVLNSPNLTFTDVVSIVPGSVTVLDVSAFGSSLAARSITELIDFAGGFENYTEGSLSVIGVGEGLTPSLQFDAATGKLALEVSATSKPEEPAAPPSYKVDPATLGSNGSAVYMQLADAARENRYDGVLGALARAVAATTDAAELKELLGQVNGSIYTTQMSAQIDGNRAAMSTLRDLMGYGQEPVRSRRGYRFAVQATSAAGSSDGDVNAPGYDRRSFGGLLMAERSVGKRIVVGLSAGYEHANVEADGSDKWESDDTRLSAHLLALGKAWQSRSILGFGIHEYDMKRNVNAGGISGTTQSSPSGFSVNVMEEVAYLVKLNERSSAEPFLRIESSYNGIDGATESGSLGNAALEIDSQDAWATTVTLGARYLRQFTMRGVLPVSRLMVEAGISKSIGAEGETLTAHFAGDSARRFRLTPAERDRWGVTLGGSFLLPLSSKQMINIGAKIQLRGSSTEANANAGYQIMF